MNYDRGINYSGIDLQKHDLHALVIVKHDFHTSYTPFHNSIAISNKKESTSVSKTLKLTCLDQFMPT